MSNTDLSCTSKIQNLPSVITDYINNKMMPLTIQCRCRQT